MDRKDIEYIKNAIEWMTENTVITKQHSSSFEETFYNTTRNSLNILERALEETTHESAALPLHGVSNRRELLFAFLKANENQTIPDYDSNKHLMIDAFLGKQ